MNKIGELMAELVRRNDLVEGTLYLHPAFPIWLH